MRIDDGNLKNLYRSYILTRIPLSRQACPSSEKISNLLTDPGLKAEKEKIIDHITNCSGCAQEFDVLLEIFRQEQKLVEEISLFIKNEGGPSPFSKKKIKKQKKFILAHKLALASVTVMVLIGATYLITNRFIFNNKTEKRGDKTGQISLIEPHADYDTKIPLLFRWDEMPGRDYFIVEIFDESLSPLWKSAKVFENFYRLPSNVERQMHRGRSYFWMITVFFPDGFTRESHLEEFRIAD